jgi:hypothetical protein
MTSRRHALGEALGALLLAVSLSATLAACGGDADDGQVATDTSPTTAPTSTTTVEPSPSGPTAVPEAGSLPDYPYADYSYSLEMRCYCANQDQQYRITVAGGEVTDVTWATEGDGHAVGDPVSDEYARVTIQDVIDKGNDPEAAQVDVEWPAGQDYPSSIYVDQDQMVADEEVTWVISDVEPA